MNRRITALENELECLVPYPEFDELKSLVEELREGQDNVRGAEPPESMEKEELEVPGSQNTDEVKSPVSSHSKPRVITS
jgi:hypothetical protein